MLPDDELQRILDWYVRHEWCTKGFRAFLNEKLIRAELND